MGNWSSRRGEGKTAKWLFDHAAYAGDDCLAWPFSRHPTGYGSFGYLGEMHYAHRFMCEIAHGDAPFDKTYASHSCGNGHKGCVNPKHLSWKTPTDNQLDRGRHGTKARGGRVTSFTARQVTEMRRLRATKTQEQIAKIFNTTRSTIRYWLDGDHVPVPPSQSYQAIQRRKRNNVLFR